MTRMSNKRKQLEIDDATLRKSNAELWGMISKQESKIADLERQLMDERRSQAEMVARRSRQMDGRVMVIDGKRGK